MIERHVRHDVVIALSYYTPYVSGLTETARVVAEGAAAAGLRVLVVATRHDRSLPPRETLHGVDVVRCPVIAQVSKGAVSPLFPLMAARAARRARVLHMHLPLMESSAIAMLAGHRVPLLTTYHCDVELEGGAASRAIVGLLDRSNRSAIRRSHAVVVSTEDFATASRVSDALGRHRIVPIMPPVQDRSPGAPTYRDGRGLHVGFLGRIVAEKGVEHLVEAFRMLPDARDARLLIGGDYSRVAGGSVVDRVRAAAGNDPRIRLLGFVPDERIADFYASIDVFALPSVNSLETFGIAQAEAMLAGVPVLASDLPGMRQPVLITGFGVLARPGDPTSIRDALLRLRTEPPDDAARERARSAFSAAGTVARYLEVYASLSRRSAAPEG